MSIKRIELFGCPMDCATMEQTVDYVDRNIQQNLFVQHGAINVAKLVNMQHDSALRAAVSACDHISIDGMGIVWAARLLGYKVPERVAGIDLFWRLNKLCASRGHPVFLLGAEDDIVKDTAAKLRDAFPALRIAGIHHGYFWEDESRVVQLIRDSGAKVLYVAITSPKKEIFINKWKHEFNVNFVMGVGGTFDVTAGKVSRAPKFMQKFGLEWFYRALREPRRLLKRYLYTNLRFFLMMCRALLTGKERPDHQ